MATVDTTDATAEDAETATRPVVRLHPDHDWFLVQLVEDANSGIGLGVTLHVKGLIVSGDTISAVEYFRGFADQIRGGNWNGHDGDQLKGDYAAACESNTAIYDRPADAPEDWRPPRPGFIHLKNAQVFSAAGRPIPSQGTLWRGRISSVDAFSLDAVTDLRLRQFWRDAVPPCLSVRCQR